MYFAYALPLNPNIGYEIGPTQDPLDYPAKAKGLIAIQITPDMKNIAEARPINLEKLCRVQARTCNRRGHGPAQEAL
mgnify:CR=1 FL=1